VFCRLPAGMEAVKQLLSLAAFGSRSRLYSCRTGQQQQLLAPAFLEVHAQILAALKAWCHWLAALHSESLRSDESLIKGGIFWIFPFYVRYRIQHFFIRRPSDSTVSENARIEPRTVATTALSVRCSNHSARSHPQFRFYPHRDMPSLFYH
jgi:hypothetical protein